MLGSWRQQEQELAAIISAETSPCTLPPPAAYPASTSHSQQVINGGGSHWVYNENRAIHRNLREV